MFIKQKRVQSSYNLFMKYYVYTVNEKRKNSFSEIFPIVYSLLSLRIILSISITLHFFHPLSSCSNCNLLLLTR